MCTFLPGQWLTVSHYEIEGSNQAARVRPNGALMKGLYRRSSISEANVVRLVAFESSEISHHHRVEVGLAVFSASNIESSGSYESGSATLCNDSSYLCIDRHFEKRHEIVSRAFGRFCCSSTPQCASKAMLDNQEGTLAESRVNKIASCIKHIKRGNKRKSWQWPMLAV